MKAKVSEATGPVLDWMVAKIEGRALKRNPMGPQGGHGWWVWEETPSGRGGILVEKSIYMAIGPYVQPRIRTSGKRYTPSTDWSQGGPIIEREKIDLCWSPGRTACMATISVLWPKELDCGLRCVSVVGPTPLIAAMRCFVASKLGDEVDVPEELTS